MQEKELIRRHPWYGTRIYRSKARRWGLQEEKELLAYHEQGKTIAQLGELLCRSKGSVVQKLWKLKKAG